MSFDGTYYSRTQHLHRGCRDKLISCNTDIVDVDLSTKAKKRKKVVICSILACEPAILKSEEKKMCNRTVWVKKWLMDRREKVEYDLLLNQLRLEDQEAFRRYLRMNLDPFEELMRLVGPSITKQRTVMRDPVPAEAK